MTTTWVAAELGGLIAQRASEAEVWDAHDVLCAVMPAFRGYGGYVRVPPWRYDRAAVLELPMPGGPTWEDDWWVGFDTGHGCDEWLDPDVEESLYEQTMRAAGLTSPFMSDNPIVWTLEKMRAAVELLAQRVHELDINV